MNIILIARATVFLLWIFGFLTVARSHFAALSGDQSARVLLAVKSAVRNHGTYATFVKDINDANFSPLAFAALMQAERTTASGLTTASVREIMLKF